MDVPVASRVVETSKARHVIYTCISALGKLRQVTSSKPALHNKILPTPHPKGLSSLKKNPAKKPMTKFHLPLCVLGGLGGSSTLQRGEPATCPLTSVSLTL